MESSHQASINLQIGGEINENDDHSKFALEWVAGAEYTQEQLEKFGDLSQEYNFELQNSWIITFCCLPNDQHKLFQNLSSWLGTGSINIQLFQYIQAIQKQNLGTLKIVKFNNNQVAILIKLQDFPSKMMQQHLSTALEGKSVSAKNIFKLNLDLISGNSIGGSQEYAKQGQNLVETLFRSFKIKFNFEVTEGLIEALFSLVSQIWPQLSKSPMQTLKEVSNFKLSLKFRDLNQMPSSGFKENVFKWVNGFAEGLKIQDQGEYEALSELLSLIGPKIEGFLFLKDISCCKIEIRIPDFVNLILPHFLKNSKE